MKSFIIKALMGVAAVQAVSVESMAKLSAQLDSSKITAGKPLYVRCPYIKNTSNRLHRKASVSVDGVQVASADDKTDDPVDFFFSFKNLNLDQNTVRVNLWKPSDGVTPKQIRGAENCELPDPVPAFLVTVTATIAPGSKDVAFQSTLPDGTLSLWDERDAFDGTRIPREKVAWQIEAFGKDGTFEAIGCCFLESEGEDSTKLVREFKQVYGPAGLLATQSIAAAVGDAFCMQAQDPSPAPASDVNVVDVQKEITGKAKAVGTVALTNSVLDGLTPTTTVIPQIQSIAPVLTADGFCAGFDLVYVQDIDVDLYDTTNASLTVGTPYDLTLGSFPIIESIYSVISSPDQQSSDYLAFRLVIEDATDRVVKGATATQTIDCGRFQDDVDLQTNLVCNPYSTVIGMEGMAWAANGAITEMTVTSVPVNGGVSQAQFDAWSFIGTLLDDMYANQADSTGFGYTTDDVPTGIDTLTITAGVYPVIETVEAFEGPFGVCTQIILTFKNTTPPSVTYQFAFSPGTSVGTATWTNANEYLEVIQSSDDGNTSSYIALNFSGNNGTSLECGNFQSFDATTQNNEPIVIIQADPIPSIMDFDSDGLSINGAIIYTVDYATVTPDQLCIRNNDC